MVNAMVVDALRSLHRQVICGYAFDYVKWGYSCRAAEWIILPLFSADKWYEMEIQFATSWKQSST